MIRALVKLWDQFWFQPRSPIPVAAFRILFGLIVILFCILLAPDLFTWFGSRGLVSNQSMHGWNIYVGLNLLNVFPDNDAWLVFTFSIFALAAVFLTIGFHTRISAMIVFAGICSCYHRNQLLFNSGDTFMRQMAFWLMFSAAGQALSVDQLLKNKSGQKDFSVWQCELASPWAHRLLQIQFTLVYAHSFFSKIQGYSWQLGTAVYYSSRLEDLRRFALPYLFDHLWTCQLLTYSTLMIEASLFTLIWVKSLRYWVLLAGLCLHLGIEVNMSIPLFEWLMMASFVLFIYPEDIKRVVEPVLARAKGLHSSSA